MGIELLVGLYVIFLIMSVILKWHKVPRTSLTGYLSGAILLAYCIYLHATNGLVGGHEYIVFLSVALIQLSALEIDKKTQKINWLHHVIRLVVHILIVWGLLFIK